MIMKNVAATGNIIFIYLTALLMVLLFTNEKSQMTAFIWQHFFHNNIFVPLSFLLVFGTVMYIINILFFLKARNRTWSSLALARTNLIVKLIQIPAYLLIFGMGLLCMVMIFTIGISFVLMLLDAFALGMTGLFAVTVFYILRKEKKITGKMQTFYSLTSFLFCVDVIIAIIGCHISRSNEETSPILPD